MSFYGTVFTPEGRGINKRVGQAAASVHVRTWCVCARRHEPGDRVVRRIVFGAQVVVEESAGNGRAQTDTAAASVRLFARQCA